MDTIERLKTAMLVDDESIDQMIYRRVIKRSGLIDQVECFSYAKDALAYLKSTDRAEIDVIFLDINMPAMNGFEFLDAALEEIGEGFTKVVVIMLTTSMDSRDKNKAACYDVIKDYINKPLEIEDVRKVVGIVRSQAQAQ